MVLLTSPTLESTYCCVQPTPRSHSSCHSPHPPQLPNHAPLTGTRHRQQCLSKLVLPTSPSNLVALECVLLFTPIPHSHLPQSPGLRFPYSTVLFAGHKVGTRSGLSFSTVSQAKKRPQRGVCSPEMPEPWNSQAQKGPQQKTQKQVLLIACSARASLPPPRSTKPALVPPPCLSVPYQDLATGTAPNFLL